MKTKKSKAKKKEEQYGHCPKCSRILVSDYKDLGFSLTRNILYKCRCRWKGYYFEKDFEGKRRLYLTEDEYSIFQLRSNKRKEIIKQAIGLEKQLEKNCWEQEWKVIRSNFFVQYLWENSYVKKREVRKLFKSFKNIIGEKVDKVKFYKLLGENSEWSYIGGEDKIRIIGLPDFIVMDGDNLPFWIEVKSGKAVLSLKQKKIIKQLNDIGFKTFIYRGEEWEEFKNQMDNGVLISEDEIKTKKKLKKTKTVVKKKFKKTKTVVKKKPKVKKLKPFSAENLKKE